MSRTRRRTRPPPGLTQRVRHCPIPAPRRPMPDARRAGRRATTDSIRPLAPPGATGHRLQRRRDRGRERFVLVGHRSTDICRGDSARQDRTGMQQSMSTGDASQQLRVRPPAVRRAPRVSAGRPRAPLESARGARPPVGPGASVELSTTPLAFPATGTTTPAYGGQRGRRERGPGQRAGHAGACGHDAAPTPTDEGQDDHFGKPPFRIMPGGHA